MILILMTIISIIIKYLNNKIIKLNLGKFSLINFLSKNFDFKKLIKKTKK